MTAGAAGFRGTGLRGTHAGCSARKAERRVITGSRCLCRAEARGNTLPNSALGNDRNSASFARVMPVNNLLCQKRLSGRNSNIPELGALRLGNRDGERRIDIFRGERGTTNGTRSSRFS